MMATVDPTMVLKEDLELMPVEKRELTPQDDLILDRQGRSGLASQSIKLMGPEGALLTLEFSLDGRQLMTAGTDKKIWLYKVYGDNSGEGYASGHNGAILEAHWTMDNKNIITCSADHSCSIWDAQEGRRSKKLAGHSGIVNSIKVSRHAPPLIVSGGDDGAVKLWDQRTRRCIRTIEHEYQILSVEFDNSSDQFFAGSLDNEIYVYDIRTGERLYMLSGHADSITSLVVSCDGRFLMSNSMDQTLRIWDIQPFFSGTDRCVGILTGAWHNFEKNLHRGSWSPSDRHIAVGSADKTVCIWSVETLRLVSRLPGHSGAVSDVSYHPTEPVIASCGHDRVVWMGEIQL